MCAKLEHVKFQPSIARGTFSNRRLNAGGRKNCFFQRKTGHISETVRDMAKVTRLLLVINRKWHTPF